MKEYDHKEIESRWQKAWKDSHAGEADADQKKKKTYLLVEFPFPSGEGLHAGHVRSYTAMDVIARKRRRQGENVLYPIGWDAFGLPTENYAIKTGKDPRVATKENTDNFRRQLQSLGISFDWSREVNTTDPRYYTWTQWIFLQMYKKGLAYKATTTINWCPKCKIGLANEEVVAGMCERCGTPVEKREKEQWMLAITKYAQRLYDDIDALDYITPAKTGQKNWIGPSEGAEIEFPLAMIPGQTDGKHKVTVFTTRPDTLFGATFLAISPELAKKWVDVGWKASEEVKNFLTTELARRKDDAFIGETEKRGVDANITAENPATKKQIPVWIVNYVLGDVGTGAIMAVPAHDERDFYFAKKFSLPVIPVIEPITGVPQEKPEFRKSIVALLRNKDGKILSLDWGKSGGNLFIGGGREGDEDPVECAKREILEETGYKNVKFVAQTQTIHHQYFAISKNVARNIDAIGLLFDLVDEEKGATALEKNEQGKFSVSWLTQKEAKERVKDELHATCLALLLENPCYTGAGILTHSGRFNGTKSEEAKWTITESVGGKRTTTFKLRDWVFSRQRYWGEPIPMISCGSCGWVPVPEKDLPVTLPVVKKYEPTDNGESPLANIDEWVNVTCPTCGKAAKRETDVMPNWAGSSWYYLRYTDPTNDAAFAGKDALKYWTPVDWYNGGMEHTTLHLLYSRFWHKFLFDIGVVPTPEPYQKRTSHGMILAEGGEKMSKSKGNVVNPDDIVSRYGADTLRVYEMFMGPFDQAIAWSEENIIGPRRFLERVWRLSGRVSSDAKENDEVARVLHETIKKVTDDIEQMGFNTAISQLMILLNALEKAGGTTKKTYLLLLQLVAPFAPHMSEELWETMGEKGSVHASPWPAYDPALLVRGTVTIAVQVAGKVRGTIEVSPDTSEAEVVALASKEPAITKWLEGKTPKRTIFVKGKILNFIL